MRNLAFAENEFYHIYNRGVDKRNIFSSQSDLERFIASMEQFNTNEVLGNLGRDVSKDNKNKLVNIIAFSLSKNHFHLILEQIIENGIEKFMHKLSMGYAKYFNARNQRSGALFQGRFKAIHIDSDDYLLHLSAYINLNERGHKISNFLGRSSWNEYLGIASTNICKKEIILERFKTTQEYKRFAEETSKDIVRRKEALKESGVSLLTSGVNRGEFKYK